MPLQLSALNLFANFLHPLSFHLLLSLLRQKEKHSDFIKNSRAKSWASLVAQLIKNPPAMWETCVQSLGWEDPWRRKRLPNPVFSPGELHGLYSPWGHKESDMTE